MTTKKAYMYVLECADKTLYTGYTTDLQKRLATHNAGKGAKYTRYRLPVSLLYYEVFDSKEAAMSAEALFKKRKQEARNWPILLLIKRKEKSLRLIISMIFYASLSSTGTNSLIGNFKTSDKIKGTTSSVTSEY